MTLEATERMCRLLQAQIRDLMNGQNKLLRERDRLEQRIAALEARVNNDVGTNQAEVILQGVYRDAVKRGPGRPRKDAA